jgi:dolichol-phosphate mannosyltransferase
LEKIRTILPTIKILFIDDNSPDGTGTEIENIQKVDPNILLIKRPSKLGLGSAYKDAFRYVISNKLDDNIITMDGDLSHPLESLPKIINQLQTYDLIIGSRYITGGKIENWSLFRRLLSRGGNWYAKILTNLPIKDLTSGFLGCRTDFLAKLNLDEIQTQGYAFLVQLKTALFAQQPNFIELPITFSERRQGKSKLNPGIFWEELFYPWKYLFTQRVKKHGYRGLFGILVFLCSFLLYAYAAPKTIFVGDSPEFINSVITWGVPHPPGYPGYVLLGKLFSFLPISSLEYRINLFSALSAATTLTLLFFIANRALGQIHNQQNSSDHNWIHNFLVFLGLGIFGLTDLFFSQAVMAKPYMIFLLFLTLITFWTIKFFETSQRRYLYLSFLLIGFGFGVHQMMLFFTVAFAALFLARLSYASQITALNKFLIHHWKILLQALIWFFLGLTNYLYLFARFSADPTLSWGKENNPFLSTLNYFLRTYYSDYGTFINFNINDKLKYLYSFSQQIFSNFHLLLIVSLVGICASLYFNRKLFFSILSVILLNVLPIIILRNELWSPANEQLYYYYYLPAMAGLALFFIIGLKYLFILITTKINRIQALTIILCLTAFLSFGDIRQSFAKNNLHNFQAINQYSKKLLTSLEPNAVLIMNFEGSSTDTMSFAIDYQMRTNQIRPDVSLMSDIINQIKTQTQAGARRVLLDLATNNPTFENRPIYTTFFPETINAKYSCQPTGFVCKVVTKNNRTFNPQPYEFSISESDYKVLEQNFFGQDFIAYLSYMQAAYILPQNQFLNSQNKFIDALKLDNDVAGLDIAGYRTYRDLYLKK